jgi:glycosyltransferase involved in cell wall biosynthesis
MINKIKFSVGIPAYKDSFLYECISSILNQSYPEFELIIINDFSPYPIDEIIAQFNDTRIRYFINDKNIGAENVVNNFNKCLEKAEGEYFILMGDDDKMEQDYLEEFEKLVLKYPDLDIYHCRSKIIDENSQPIALTPSWPEYESVYDNIWHRLNEHRNNFIADFVYRRSALINNGGFYYLPLAWGTDDITAYMSINNKGIAHINKPILNYRSHPNTISSMGNHELKMKAIMLQEIWFNNFLLRKPQLDNDLIIYNNLCRNINKLFQKKKIHAITSSLSGHFFKSCIKLIYNHKKYNIIFIEIIYSFIDYFKIKMAKKKYY